MRVLLPALLLAASPTAALTSFARVAPLPKRRVSHLVRACADRPESEPADGHNARSLAWINFTPKGAMKDMFKWLDRPTQMSARSEAVYKGVVRTAFLQGPIVLVAYGLGGHPGR